MRPDLRRPQSRHPSLSGLAVWLGGAFVVYGTQTIGWGLGAGVLLVVAAFAIAYAWKRLRPQSPGSAQRPPS